MQIARLPSQKAVVGLGDNGGDALPRQQLATVRLTGPPPAISTGVRVASGAGGDGVSVTGPLRFLRRTQAAMRRVTHQNGLRAISDQGIVASATGELRRTLSTKVTLAARGGTQAEADEMAGQWVCRKRTSGRHRAEVLAPRRRIERPTFPLGGEASIH